MACATTDIYTYLGADGPVCSGRGTCVAGECVCDSMFTGAADMFSLDGEACQNPVVLDRFMWALALAAWFKLMLQAWYMFYERMARRARAGNRTVGFQAFVALPIMVSALAVRAGTGRNIGVDLAESVLFSLALTVNTWSGWWTIHSIMRPLLLGSAQLGATADAQSFISTALYVGAGINVFYTVAMFGTQVGACFLAVGPSTNRIIMLVVRNVCTVLYFCFFLILDAAQLRALKLLLGATRSRDRSVDNENLQKTLVKFEATIRATVPRICAMAGAFPRACPD